MAAATSVVIGAGLAAYQISEAEKAKKKANRELNNYERQDLDNAFKEISISTLGSDLIREESQRTTAGLVDVMQNGGARTILGGIPRVVGAMNQSNLEAAKLLDGQYQNREYAIAGDNARIEGIRENRDNMNISALSSQVNAAKQDAMNGYMGLASSVAMGAREYDRGVAKPAPSAAANYQAFNSGLNYNQPQPSPAPYFDFGADIYTPNAVEPNNPLDKINRPFYF